MKINNNKDDYIHIIQFYKTKNILRNRILIINTISSVIIFINIKTADDKNINTTFFVYNETNNICHLLLRKTKNIKINDSINISENDIKI